MEIFIDGLQTLENYRILTARGGPRDQDPSQPIVRSPSKSVEINSTLQKMLPH